MRNKLASLSLGLFCLSAGIVSAQTTLTNGLIAYWPFDITDGISTPDLALNNSLFLSNAPSNVPGEVSNCFAFAGNNYLALSYPTSSSTLPVYNTNAYTVAFWVMGSSTQAANKIIFSENNFNNSGLLFEFNTSSGKIRVDLRDNLNLTKINNVSSTNSSIFTSAGNVWHHIAWVDVHGACQLYVDGIADTNVTYSPSYGGQTGNITTVGALVRSSGVADLFTGSVDELMEWKRALSQAEIQEVMTGGIPEPIQPTPPTFVTSPASGTNAMGDRVILSATVFGNQPISYQWFSNSIAIPNQTNSTVVLTGQTMPGVSSYTLTAINSAGTNTSAPATILVLPDSPATNIDAGLAGYYPFNTISNSASSPDLVSQNDLQLTAMSSANLVSGEFGAALSFDGATQYGSETTGEPIYDLSATYTVAFWVKGAGEQTDAQVFANGNSTNGSYFFIGTDNTGASGKVDVRVNPGFADIVSTNTAFDGTWHHIAWVDQDGTGLLYIDGVLDQAVYNYGHAALGSPLLNNTSVGALLADPLRDFYAGDIDDLATWNRRLSYTEIQAIIATGIPTPATVIKPSVSTPTTQPANLAGGIYQGDSVSITAAASGTAPLSYQWYFGNTPISGTSNPSALSNMLALSNVQPAESGSYSLVVSNSAGGATSSVVVLNVTPYTPATNGTVLKVEFNFAAGPIVQPGFSSMTLSGNPAVFGGPSITLSPIGSTSLTDRARTTTTNNPPTLTQADIYSQFIFSTATTPGTGLDVLIQRLAPNTTYGVTIWSWDSENSAIENWTENASGAPVTIANAYAFDGQIAPSDYSDTFGSLVTSSATGQLDLQGIVSPYNTVVSVFLNAMVLVANPTIQITSVQVAADGNLQLTILLQYVGEQIDFQESPNLLPGSWQEAQDADITATAGPTATVEFPISSSQQFYRVVNP